MVLIGVTGGSGSGKSTVTNFLKEKISDCITINLDEYMRKFCNEHKDEIILKLNLDIGNTYWSTHLVNSYEDIKDWVRIIESDIEVSIRKIILDNKNSEKVIILDWAFLSLLPIYNECDFSVFVKGDLIIKLNRLTKRLEEDNKLEKWNYILVERLKNTALDQFGHCATHIISNNGTLQQLEYNVDCILDKYKNKLQLKNKATLVC